METARVSAVSRLHSCSQACSLCVHHALIVPMSMRAFAQRRWGSFLVQVRHVVPVLQDQGITCMLWE